MPFCTKCGTQNQDAVSFCSSCGNNMNQKLTSWGIGKNIIAIASIVGFVAMFLPWQSAYGYSLNGWGIPSGGYWLIISGILALTFLLVPISSIITKGKNSHIAFPIISLIILLVSVTSYEGVSPDGIGLYLFILSAIAVICGVYLQNNGKL